MVFRIFWNFPISWIVSQRLSPDWNKKKDPKTSSNARCAFFAFFNLKDCRCSLEFIFNFWQSKQTLMAGKRANAKEATRERRPEKAEARKVQATESERPTKARECKKWMNSFTVYSERESVWPTLVIPRTQTHAQRKTTINQLPFDKACRKFDCKL